MCIHVPRDLVKCCDHCSVKGAPIPQLQAITKRSTPTRQTNAKRPQEKNDVDTAKQLREALITERDKMF